MASKLLAGVMVLPLGIRFVLRTVRDRGVDRDQLRYILFAFAGLGLFVVLPLWVFGDVELWRDYYRRMLVTFHEHYYANQHSFRDLFLQAVHEPTLLWHPLPERVAAGDPQVAIGDVRAAFTVAQAVLLGGLGFVAYRNPVRVAFALGPLAVFVMLVSNRYYWQMWLIAAIVLAPGYVKTRRHAIFLSAIAVWLGVNYLRLLTPEGWREGGYIGSYCLFWIIVLLVGTETVSWYRERCRARQSRS